jgi:serine/threonine-protein kinase
MEKCENALGEAMVDPNDSGAAMLSGAPLGRFRFADLTLDLGQRRLTRDGDPVPLSNLSFELLRVLVQAWPNLVSHEALAHAVWGPRRVVTPENLARRVLLLRAALGDSAEAPHYFEVVRGQGYRLIPPVETQPPVPNGEGPGGQPAATRRGVPYRGIALALSIAALLLALTTYLGFVREDDPPAAVVRFEIVPPADTPFSAGDTTRNIAISPDGSHIAYKTGASLAVRSLDQLDAITLTGLGQGSHTPTFSPDGKYLAYLVGSVLRTIAVSGAGAIETIATVGQFTDGDLSWGADWTFLLANSVGLHRVRADDGSTALLAVPDALQGERAFNAPSLLPGGTRALLSIEPIRAQAGSRIAVLELGTGERHYLIDGGTQPVYVAPGYLVFARKHELRAVQFDANTLAVGAVEIVLATGVMVNPNGTANLSVSSNGTLIYAKGTARGTNTLMWVDPDGTEETLAVPPMSYTYPRLSPDGTRVALDVRWPDSDMWVWDLQRDFMTRLTNDPAENALPVWYPDGKALAFGDGRSGATNVYVQAADGASPPTRLTESSHRQVPFNVSPQGRHLLFGEAENDGIWRVHVRDLEAGDTRLLIDGDYSYWNTELSPDGRWLVYQSDESGSLEVYVRPFPDTAAGRWKVSQSGGAKPMWSRDGGRIFFIDPNQQLMATEVSVFPSFAAGAAVRVLDMTRYMNWPYEVGARPYDLSLDGKRVLLAQDSTRAQERVEPRIVVNVNWTLDLAQRLRAVGAD